MLLMNVTFCFGVEYCLLSFKHGHLALTCMQTLAVVYNSSDCAFVCCRLIIHGTMTLPLIYFLCTRDSPMNVLKGISPALLTALLISSR